MFSKKKILTIITILCLVLGVTGIASAGLSVDIADLGTLPAGFESDMSKMWDSVTGVSSTSFTMSHASTTFIGNAELDLFTIGFVISPTWVRNFKMEIGEAEGVDDFAGVSLNAALIGGFKITSDMDILIHIFYLPGISVSDAEFSIFTIGAQWRWNILKSMWGAGTGLEGIVIKAGIGGASTTVKYNTSSAGMSFSSGGSTLTINTMNMEYNMSNFYIEAGAAAYLRLIYFITLHAGAGFNLAVSGADVDGNGTASHGIVVDTPITIKGDSSATYFTPYVNAGITFNIAVIKIGVAVKALFNKSMSDDAILNAQFTFRVDI